MKDDNQSYSPLLLLMLMLDSAMLLYLSWKGVESGLFYFFMVLFTGVMFFFAYLFLNSEEENMIMRLPFKKDFLTGATAFLLGSLIPLIPALFKAGLTKLMNPYFLFSANLYQAFSLGSSSLFNWLISVPTAGIHEEITFGILATIIGILIGYVLFVKAFNLNFGAKGNFIFCFAIGMIVSGATFTLAHTFNPTYTSSMFIAALVFRLFMNVFMWFFVGAEATIGYHIVNNWLFLAGVQDINPIVWLVAAFLYVPLIIHVITNFKNIKMKSLFLNREAN